MLLNIRLQVLIPDSKQQHVYHYWLLVRIISVHLTAYATVHLSGIRER